MTTGDKVTFNGKDYIAVRYKDPFTLNPEQGDPQCRICQLAPNFCKLYDECHSTIPFVFVKSDIFDAILLGKIGKESTK